MAVTAAALLAEQLSVESPPLAKLHCTNEGPHVALRHIVPFAWLLAQLGRWPAHRGIRWLEILLSVLSNLTQGRFFSHQRPQCGSAFCRALPSTRGPLERGTVGGGFAAAKPMGLHIELGPAWEGLAESRFALRPLVLKEMPLP